MTIKLEGALPRELKDLGLKPGDLFDAFPAENTNTRAVRFFIRRDDENCICTIWPENFSVIK
jgi:hypothetical protein